jgi:lactaldehyde dehydrogenase (EC 1.2.1.22)
MDLHRARQCGTDQRSGPGQRARGRRGERRPPPRRPSLPSRRCQGAEGLAALTSIERGEHLRAFADALEARAVEIGQALAGESGKSLDDASNETRYAAQITRYHAEWARRIEGEIIPSDTPDEKLFLHREPIGVVACLIPFNYPVYTLLRKVAPALICGNTVVVRPSNNTPLSAFEIARAAQQAGLPAGVLNILTMDHATAASLCTHPAVGLITLTGQRRCRAHRARLLQGQHRQSLPWSLAARPQ